MITKDDIRAAARASGATDEAVALWMLKPLAGYGERPPAELIDAGQGDLVLSAIEAAAVGVYS